jgi:hypothetical protein
MIAVQILDKFSNSESENVNPLVENFMLMICKLERANNFEGAGSDFLLQSSRSFGLGVYQRCA